MTDCTAIANVCARINQRTRDPRLVLVPGLADDLRSIGEAFITLTRAVQLLARAELARQGNYPLSKADYHDLVCMAGESR